MIALLPLPEAAAVIAACTAAAIGAVLGPALWNDTRRKP